MPAGMPTTTTPTRLLSEMTTIAPATATASYVSLAGVGKTYASPRGPVPALVDIDLDIKPREFVSVVGLSAAIFAGLYVLGRSAPRPMTPASDPA